MYLLLRYGKQQGLSMVYINQFYILKRLEKFLKSCGLLINIGTYLRRN